MRAKGLRYSLRVLTDPRPPVRELGVTLYMYMCCVLLTCATGPVSNHFFVYGKQSIYKDLFVIVYDLSSVIVRFGLFTAPHITYYGSISWPYSKVDSMCIHQKQHSMSLSTPSVLMHLHRTRGLTKVPRLSIKYLSKELLSRS